MQRNGEGVIDVIKSASKLGYADHISVVDKLLDAQWCEETDLIEAYRFIQNPDIDAAALLFQLPFLVRLPRKWLRVNSEYGHPYIYFRHMHSEDLSERFPSDRLRMGAPNEISEALGKTQVILSFQLWGERARKYPQYLEAQEDAQAFANTKLTSRKTLNAGLYELNLAKRLYLQAIAILKEFIPLYSVSCFDPFARAPEKLEYYFMIVTTGRVVVRNLREYEGTTEKQSSEAPYWLNDLSSNLNTLERRLKVNRQPSIYEAYLLEAARQIELGAPNLALVQTVMLLDWFANYIIQEHLFVEMKKSFGGKSKLYDLALERMWETKKDKRVRVSTIDKFSKYLPVIGVTLPPKLREDLEKVINRRNEIVHRTQVESIEVAVARDAVHTGMAVIQKCMGCLLTSKNTLTPSGAS